MPLSVLELNGDNVEIKGLNSTESPRCFVRCGEGYKSVSAFQKLSNLFRVIRYKLVARLFSTESLDENEFYP